MIYSLTHWHGMNGDSARCKLSAKRKRLYHKWTSVFWQSMEFHGPMWGCWPTQRLPIICSSSPLTPNFTKKKDDGSFNDCGRLLHWIWSWEANGSMRSSLLRSKIYKIEVMKIKGVWWDWSWKVLWKQRPWNRQRIYFVFAYLRMHAIIWS